MVRLWSFAAMISLVGCTQAYQVDNGLSPINPTTMTVPIGTRADSAQPIVQARAVRAGFTITNAATRP